MDAPTPDPAHVPGASGSVPIGPVPPDPVPPDPVPPDPVPPVPVPTERLAARALVAYFLGGLLGLAILGLGAWFLADYLLERFADDQDWIDEYGGWVETGRWVLLGLLVLGAIVEPLLGWFFWRYSMDDELLVMRYGILSREEKVIPISRMQHVDLRRGPIQRVLGLTSLVVFTAGVGDASFRLPGLLDRRARELRDRILAARGDDVI